jgi:hypothetical protein
MKDWQDKVITIMAFVQLGLISYIAYAVSTLYNPSSNNDTHNIRIDQNNKCIVRNITNAGNKCSSGETIGFFPTTFGNTQLPIIFAMSSCNTNKPIVYNKGGVVCVYTDKRFNKVMQEFK